MTIHFKTSLVNNSDNIKYKSQKPCNENQSLKSTDLHQSQRFIESWSISIVLVPYSLRFSQVYWYYNRNIISNSTVPIETMLLSLEKETHTKKTNNNKTKQKTKTTYSSSCLHHRWRCYQEIALNDQQIGPTSLALLSP